LLHGLAMDLGKGMAFAPAVAPTPIAKGTVRFVSDTRELCWDASQPQAGYFTVNNQWAKLQHPAVDKVAVGHQWGREPVLCEGVAAEIVLPVAADRVRFYPLDELGPPHRTVWYEVEVR